MLDPANLLYIVFIIDSKYKDHDGKVFRSFIDAHDFVKDTIEITYGEKFVIGTFYYDNNREMVITSIETFGFANDKKHTNQLNLFA